MWPMGLLFSFLSANLLGVGTKKITLKDYFRIYFGIKYNLARYELKKDVYNVLR